MTKIVAWRTKCTIIDEQDASFIQALDRELSFKVQGAEHTWAFKNGQWNGVKHIMTPSLEFPYGLLERVKGFYRQHNKEFELINERPGKLPLSTLDIHSNLIAINRDPYPYQWDTLEKVKEHDCGIIRIATGGGKCNSSNSLTLTNRGMLEMGEIGCGLNMGETKQMKWEVATPLAKKGIDVTSHIYRDGFGPSRLIETERLFWSQSTSQHRIKVLSKDGIINWKYVKDVTKGDVVVLCSGQGLFGTNNDLSEDDAYFWGLLCGDGGLTTKFNICLTNSDEHILSFARKYIKHHLGFNIYEKQSISEKTGVITSSLNFHNKAYRQKIKKMGMDYSKSINKSIPRIIRESTKKNVAAFIRGLYEADGWIGDEKSKPTICIGLSSKKLIDQLHVVLLNFGILACRRIKKTAHADSHILTIYRGHIPVFLQEIGLEKNGHKYKKIMSAMEKINGKKQNSNIDIIPNQNNHIYEIIRLSKRIWPNAVANTFAEAGINWNTLRSWSGESAWRNPSRASLIDYCSKLKIILSKTKSPLAGQITAVINRIEYNCSSCFIYDKVKSIKHTISDNYDFVVPETHSFVSQGFVNHNTVVAAMTAAHFGKRTIVYVIGKDLLYQIHGFFSKIFDQEIGIIGDGKCEIHDINIVSVWTIGQALGMEKNKILLDTTDKEKSVDVDKYKNILDLMRTAQLHVFDECHLASCDTIQEISKKINPEYVYGMSASPWRDDGHDLLIEGIFGSTIVDVSASHLIKHGYLAKPIIKFYRVPKQTFSSKDQYQTVYKQYITDNEARNKLVVRGTEQLVKQGYQTLVLFTRLNHGKLLYKELSQRTDCLMLSGKDSTKVRELAKKKLENGEINCIVASTIFDIGVDLPSLSGLVIAGGGKSSVRACQRIGRVIRKYKKGNYEKKHAAVIDFLDQAKFLKRHSAARYKIYATEEEFDLHWPK